MPVDDALDQARLDFARGDVVEEEERPRALHEDVVHAVVDEIARRTVSWRPISIATLSFVPTPSVEATRTGSLVVREVRPEEAAEAPDVAEHARREGRADGGLGAREGGGLRVDVDAGFGVAGVFQGQRIIAKRGASRDGVGSARSMTSASTGSMRPGKRPTERPSNRRASSASASAACACVEREQIRPGAARE